MSQQINVSDPWFKAISSGKKTIEGRLHKGKFADMAPGTVLAIQKSGGWKTVVAVVSKVVRYPSFEQYLSCEGLNRTLPGLTSIAEGVRIYRQFYSEEDERKYGVSAVHIVLSV